MNLNEAKQILNDNGYRMEMPLDEALEVLKSNGFLCEGGVTMNDLYNDDDEDVEDDFTEDQAEEENGNKESKDNSKMSKEQKDQLSKIKNKLSNIDSYDEFVKVLAGMNENQAKLLKRLVGNGPEAQSIQAKKGNLSVKLLHPTQQEIDVNNSLAFPLKKNPGSILDILKGEHPFTINNSPIVVYKYGSTYYIIDGHHRWSQIYLLNPNAQMNCLLYTAPEKGEDPIDVLRDFQLVIKATTGEVKVADADSEFNVYKMNEGQVRQYVMKTMTDKAFEEFHKYTIDDTPAFNEKKDVAAYIGKNAMKLKDKNGPADGAPRRNIMPQTDQQTLAVAAKGMTNI